MKEPTIWIAENSNSYYDTTTFIDLPLRNEQIEAAYKFFNAYFLDKLKVNTYGITSVIHGLSELLYDSLLEEINYLASLIQSMPDSNKNKFEAIIQNPAYCSNAKDAINLAYNLACFEHLPEIRTDVAYSLHMHQNPEDEGWFMPPVISQFGCARMYAHGQIFDYYNGLNIPLRHQIPPYSSIMPKPTVTILWSESSGIFPQNYTLNEADYILKTLDSQKYKECHGELYDKVSYEIGYVIKGEMCYYPGVFEIGVENGGLINSVGRYNYAGESHEGPHKRPKITGAILAEYLRQHYKINYCEDTIARQIDDYNSQPNSTQKFLHLAYCYEWKDYFASCRQELNTSTEYFYIFPVVPEPIEKGSRRRPDYLAYLFDIRHERIAARQEAAKVGLPVQDYLCLKYGVDSISKISDCMVISATPTEQVCSKRIPRYRAAPEHNPR